MTDPTLSRCDAEQRALELKAAEGDLIARIELLRRTLTGIATNGTNCGACSMSNTSARLALERDDRIALGEC